MGFCVLCGQMCPVTFHWETSKHQHAEVSLLKLLTFPREKYTGGCWVWGRNRQERKMWRGLHFHVYTSTCAVYLQPPASPFWSALSLVLGKMGLKKSPVCWGCRRRHTKRSQYKKKTKRFLKNFHVTAVKLTSVFDPYQTLWSLFKTFLGPAVLSPFFIGPL